MAISADSGHSTASYRYRGSITPRAHLLEKVGSRCKHTKRDALFLVKQDEQQAGRAQQEGIEQQSALPPLYLAVSNIGVLFILWFGGKNVLGTEWQSWNIAAFTTFLPCFVRMAAKSSKAAKLFNAVQRAKVS